jgi:hypothetical protein
MGVLIVLRFENAGFVRSHVGLTIVTIVKLASQLDSCPLESSH